MKAWLPAIAGLCLVGGLAGGCDRPDAGEGAKAATQAPAPAYVRAHTLQQLMATVLEPQAQVYWKSAGSVSDATGHHDLTPTSDEGWLATQSAAATVTEMGNLLMTPLFAEGRGEDWMQFSAALVQVGQRAEKAAADRDSDAVFKVGGTLYEVCSACHQAYPPKALADADAAAPEGGTNAS